MIDLKPCPFCGGEAKMFVQSGEYGGVCVKCMSCWCQTAIRTDGCIARAEKTNAVELCIEAWNRRKGEDNG